MGMQFEAFFKEIVQKDAFPYQVRLAETPFGGFPRLLNVPTSSGKTAAVVAAWLWRRLLHPDERVRNETPRRLVYCLPSRVLVEQTRRAVDGYLARLVTVAARTASGSKVPRATTLMGGAGGGPRSERDEWMLHPEMDQILVGTQDMLLSRALNRGYGSTRFAWPREFGLLNNDVLWVFDEVQLMSSGLSTSAQLEAMRARFGAFGPVRSLWLSATLEPSWLATVDHAEPAGADILRLDSADRAKPELAKRLNASKRLKRAEPIVPEKATGITAYARQVAGLVVERHRPGTLSLVVVNTIPRAKGIYEAVRREQAWGASRPEMRLVHSHFRAFDRGSLVDAVLSPVPPEGRVIVSTQVVEAGVNISARLLFTELAPWGSMVQRLGRCNRYGEANDGEAYWFDVGDEACAPNTPEELGVSRFNLAALPEVSGASPASPEVLSQFTIPRPRTTHILRAPDLIGLFDTTPDLSGFDVDVSRFVRDTPDHDVQVFWRKWEGDRPPEALEAPHHGECCPAPIGDVRDLLAKQKEFWRWDQLAGGWARARAVYPGQTLLLDATGGGYSVEMGWDPGARSPVEEVRPAPEASTRVPGQPNPSPAGEAGNETFGGDRSSTGASRWVTIAEHTDVTVETARAVVEALGTLQLPAGLTQAVLRAARWHDRGKAHAEFQNTLLANVPETERPARTTKLWAKSAGGRSKHTRKYLRHELASAMAYVRQEKSGSPRPSQPNGDSFLVDLAAYLIAAHHGKVRLSIRSMPNEKAPRNGRVRRYAMGIEEGEMLPATDLGSGESAEPTTIDLSMMEIGSGTGGTASWVERTTALRDSREVGPFRLAFLEAILRAADVRASMTHEKGGATDG